nr:hypothetical protein [Streptomyces katrae]
MVGRCSYLSPRERQLLAAAWARDPDSGPTDEERRLLEELRRRHRVASERGDGSARSHAVAASGSAPRTAAAAPFQQAAKAGDVLCHLGSPHSWTHHERLYAAGAGVGRVPRSRRAEASAWLASALLRRVGLWSAAGIALSTTSWTNPDNGGEQSITDHIHQPTPGTLHHDELVHLLTDPEWGMQIKVEDRWCACTQRGESCLVKLRSTQGEAGELELRFPRRETPRSVQACGQELYAAKTRASITVPERTRRLRC